MRKIALALMTCAIPSLGLAQTYQGPAIVKGTLTPGNCVEVAAEGSPYLIDAGGECGDAPDGVASFNDRTGAITLSSADVTGALTFTPLRPSNNLSDLSSATTARANLGLVIGTNVQAWSSVLDTWASRTPYAGVLVIGSGKTLTVSNTLTFTGTDGSSVAFGAGGTVLYNGGALGTPSSGVATNLTGTAAGLTAGTVTTNANLTGPITSIGNATAIASQAGTGTTFVMSQGPTITNLIVSGTLDLPSLSVVNAALANPATTVNGQVCTLGSTCTVAAAAGTLTGATLASGVTASSLTSAAGGTFGSNAFNSTAYSPAANPTLTGAVTISGQLVLNAPTSPTCGTGCASVSGNDQAFTVTTGTAQTSVVVNFGHTWASIPRCALGTGSTASVVDIASKSTTQIVLGASLGLTGTNIDVICF